MDAEGSGGCMVDIVRRVWPASLHHNVFGLLLQISNPRFKAAITALFLLIFEMES